MTYGTKSLSYSGGGAHLTVTVSVMPQMANLVDTSSKAMHEAAKTQQKIGKYDEARWLELDGLRGIASANRCRKGPTTFAGCNGRPTYVRRQHAAH